MLKSSTSGRDIIVILCSRQHKTKTLEEKKEF